MKNNIVRYVSLVLLVFWMCAIFCLSAQPATVSDDTSGGIIETVVSKLYPGYDQLKDEAKQNVISVFSAPVRKAAHFFEFAVLGFLIFVFVSTFKTLSASAVLIITVAGGLLYAASDEIHQIFVEGRACRLFDILLDFSGVLIAAAVCYLIFLRRSDRGEQ